MQKMRRIKIKGMSKRTAVAVCCILAVLVTAGALIYVQTEKPYAITVDGREVAMVEDKDDAEKAIRKLISDYTADGGKIDSITVDSDIDVSIKKIWEHCDEREVLSADEAAEDIKQDIKDNEELLNVTIVAKTETEEKYTPKTTYKPDDEMFVGDTRTEEGGRQGKKLVTKKITSVNGEMTEEKILDTEIIDEGEPTVIYMGTKGLPDGEDWKTYDGEPQFDNGADLVEYGKKFLGNPYVKGGVSLTDGCDCVGFVRAMYKFYGVNLPATLGKVGRRVSVSEIKPGDIVCYNYQHVALYLGDGKVIHSANPKKGICISDIRGNIKQIRRVID